MFIGTFPTDSNNKGDCLPKMTAEFHCKIKTELRKRNKIKGQMQIATKDSQKVDERGKGTHPKLDDNYTDSELTISLSTEIPAQIIKIDTNPDRLVTKLTFLSMES